MENKMNIFELRESLIETYRSLKEGTIGIQEAKSQANLAGKIISSAKTQMEYNIYIQSKNRIDFLDSEK